MYFKNIPARQLDLIERAIVSILLGTLIFRIVPEDPFSPDALPAIILILMECAVVAMLVFRRNTEHISTNPRDWVLGFTGTTLPLLAGAGSGNPLVPMDICSIIMISGLFVNFGAKMSLRRSFGVVAANRGVKAGGAYRFIRHPMYAGYSLTHIGYILAGPTIWNVSIYALTLACQIYRINAEERILIQDDAYKALTQRVRYRLVPGIY